ncbi:glycosyltransferase family 2 protein [Celeribacter sp. ULVN23_4]
MSLDIALVIPVHNDPDGLMRLIGEAKSLALFRQIIVIDDASTAPVLPLSGVQIYRHTDNRGAGTARNTGLDRVDSKYVLFFDADDSLLPALTLLLSDLAQLPDFDICQFKYAASEDLRHAHWGQPEYDERFWAEAGISLSRRQILTPIQTRLIAQTANYPWNKICRTDFLRRETIRFMDLPVHNDLAFHWRAFSRAETVVTSDRMCAYHRMGTSNAQLSHRMGPERLALFQALGTVADELSLEDPAWTCAFKRFALPLIAWARARIDPGLIAEFDLKAQRFRDTIGA